GVVPVVEYTANPRLSPSPYGGGVAEFEQVIDIQNRINETVFGRLLAMHFSAFRQKWATGLDIPKDENGAPIEPFNAAVGKLWATASENVKFGEFGEHTLTNYLAAAEADVQHLAAISKTPPHYLLGKMINISGDALKAAETGLVSKCSRHKRFFGESHEEVARLMVKAWQPDDPRSLDVTCETIWRDTESRSEAERVDALVKLASIGVPREVLWERIPGVTQTEIARWKNMAAEEAAVQALATITSNVAQEPPVPVGG
ncbi:MAG: phage portal protein, partial [Acidimicrobiia bacterium]